MKIKNLDKFPVNLPLAKVGYREEDKSSSVWASGVPSIIIRVNTDEGISGLGEATTMTWYLGETQEGIMKLLESYEQLLIGEDPLNIVNAHRVMDRIKGTGVAGSPGCRSARAAVDMALYDIIGKVQNRPVYEVLGGSYRTKFEMLTNLYETTPEEKAKACRESIREGFRGLKIKVGDLLLTKGWSMRNFKKEKDKLIAALEAVPPDIYIDADANQSWRNAKIALNAVEELLQSKYYPNLSLEQPLHYLDISGHSFLRKSIKIPLILDESVLSPEAMVEIVKNEAADRIVLKLGRVGGFWLACKIINIAEASSIGISVDTMPFTRLGDTANCHLAATIRDPYPVDAEGHLWFTADPFKGGIEIKKGRAILPKTPGLGIQLDEEVLRTIIKTE
ncbi:MAG: mandelate racemase/muconate lactonizing enzyme family protein [Candidatus Aerophobetes bacterium]|nr:mandelate racemase/muconate lactonizing enzyme family protein [Candidatus Aerophobetes bacterium]